MKVNDSMWLEETASGLPPVIRVPSVRATSLEEPKPLGLVWHWTGGPARGPAFASALAEEIRTYDKNKDRAASWHVLLAKDGRVIQSVPFDKGSWHVGRPGRIGGAPSKPADKWDSLAWPGRLYANINRVTVGVELENSGKLEKVGDKFYCWPYWLNPAAPPAERVPDPKVEIPASRTTLVGSVWYDDFPSAQQEAAQRLVTALVLRFKWARDVCQYGHVMFDPGRKEDPGPRWLEVLLPKILDGVFGKP